MRRKCRRRKHYCPAIRPFKTGPATALLFRNDNEGRNQANAQQVLRSSAKKLEELAAELERAKFYDKADELRKTAAQYWLQARTMD